MLEGVVGKDGTAPEAKIPGYRVAGKTGTADRYDDKTGGYSGKTASFIGFAPADDPQLVVAVTLQRPVKGYFGGVVAGPGVPRRHDLRAAGAEDPARPAPRRRPTIKLEDRGAGNVLVVSAALRPRSPRTTSLSEVAACAGVADRSGGPGPDVRRHRGDPRLAGGPARGPVRRPARGPRRTAPPSPPTSSRRGAVAVLTDAEGAELLAPRRRRRTGAWSSPHPRAVLGSGRRARATAPRPSTCGWSGSPAPTARRPPPTSSTRRWRALGHGPAWSARSRPGSADERVKSVRTTPESPDLHALLAVMRERGVRHLRDGGVQPRAGAAPGRRRSSTTSPPSPTCPRTTSTSTGRWSEYFAAKASLFTPQRARRGVVCVDDAWGRRLAPRRPCRSSP